jgi:hypothetical protein
VSNLSSRPRRCTSGTSRGATKTTIQAIKGMIKIEYKIEEMRTEDAMAKSITHLPSKKTRTMEMENLRRTLNLAKMNPSKNKIQTME